MTKALVAKGRGAKALVAKGRGAKALVATLATMPDQCLIRARRMLQGAMLAKALALRGLVLVLALQAALTLTPMKTRVLKHLSPRLQPRQLRGRLGNSGRQRV
jgi:hypothetical protein